MVRLQIAFFFVLQLGLNMFAQADVWFEGYSRVLSGGVQVGFIINKYEFDAKKKQITSTYLFKTNELGGNITESLKAVAKDDFTPVSYEFTTLAAGVPKLIDAKFTKGKMTGTIKEGSKITKINRDMPKGAFLSTFLVYVMLKGPKGLAPDVKYDYQAIAEEDGTFVKGTAFVKSQEELSGIKVFKILNEFKGVKFIAYSTEKGEVLSTKSPVQSIATELVPQSTMATNGQAVPTSLMQALFGEVPLGVTNAITQKFQNNPKAFRSTEVVSPENAAKDKAPVPVPPATPPPPAEPGK